MKVFVSRLTILHGNLIKISKNFTVNKIMKYLLLMTSHASCQNSKNVGIKYWGKCLAYSKYSCSN